MAEAESSKEAKLVDIVLQMAYLDRIRLLLGLDLLHENADEIPQSEVVRFAIEGAKASDKLLELATQVAQIQKVDVGELIDLEEEVDHTATGIYHLASLEQVNSFCYGLLEVKQEAPYSTGYTIVVTVDRKTRYRKPVDTLEVSSLCHPSSIIERIARRIEQVVPIVEIAETSQEPLQKEKVLEEKQKPISAPSRKRNRVALPSNKPVGI